jgi:hypothetical protein
MFDFLRRSTMRSPSAALCRALEADGLPPGLDPATLGVVEQRGAYSGRRVTFFRVIDRARAAAHGAKVSARLTYSDLSAHPDLVLRTGFIEPDGTVVIASRAASSDPAVPTRIQADRSAHADDERVVFPETAAGQKEARS